MTALLRRRHDSSWGLLALALPAALGCSAPLAARAPAAATASAAAPASAPAGPHPGSAENPSEPAPSDTTAVNVVTLIAKPGLWPLDVDSARRVLQALGPVTHEQPTEGELALVGGPYGALDRFSVAYTLDEQRYWVFGSAGFLLEGSDQAELYRALEAHLIQLLGKPAWREGDDGAALPTSGWDLGEEVMLSLAPSQDASAVRIAIGEPERDRR